MTTSATLTLTDFLLARIAEDEAVAQTAFAEDFGDHFTPARVLAECDAKRRIMEAEAGAHVLRDDFPPTLGYTSGPDATVTLSRAVPPDARTQLTCDEFVARFMQPAPPSYTLRLLALPYADHEDYRAEWRP